MQKVGEFFLKVAGVSVATYVTTLAASYSPPIKKFILPDVYLAEIRASSHVIELLTTAHNGKDGLAQQTAAVAALVKFADEDPEHSPALVGLKVLHDSWCHNQTDTAANLVKFSQSEVFRLRGLRWSCPRPE